MASPSQFDADIIIVGAGAAGCVISARLAAAAPDLRILVLELGPHTLDDPSILTPARFLEHMGPGIQRTLCLTSDPNDELLGPQTSVHTGACVGGGTAINFMTYTRPAASDYDDWKRLYENRGWGFESLRPLFQKLETYEPDTDDTSIHGFSGPMHVSYGSRMPEVAHQWLASALAWDKGRRELVHDINDFRTADGYGRWQKWISSDGVRQDAGHCFLYPALQAPGSNVTLRVMCRVSKVIFEGNRAVGVEYIDLTADNFPRTRIATARKLVVLSSGAFGSPGILERSGIGAATVLFAAGIPVRVQLDGVGENYQDHNLMTAQYAVEPGSIENRKASPSESEDVENGLLVGNGVDVGGKLRPTADDFEALGGKEGHYFANSPDKPAIQLGILTSSLVPGNPPGDYVTAAAYTMYPAARGSVHIRSPDAADPQRFVTGYLAAQSDVALLMWQYKVSREIARRMPCYRGEVVATHPEFAPSSAAACSTSRAPVSVEAPDIVYTADDDVALEAWVRRTVSTTWHSVGTCAMKPRAQGGVVDARLNVYGVEGLKVADISICPANVSANTQSTALVIGEKAALIVGEDLGIPTV